MASFDYIVGVDEAGRGPLAGPVAVGAVAVHARALRRLAKRAGGVRESKQLTSAAREEWFEIMCGLKRDGVLDYQCAFSGERMIDSLGIVPATARALARAVAGLSRAPMVALRPSGIDPSRTLVLLDGGLKAPSHFPHQHTIVRGDESEMLIALASIVAKVLRDRKMVRLAKRYPEYGFDRHKGYGTRLHFDRIARHGLCPLHRTSFCNFDSD